MTTYNLTEIEKFAQIGKIKKEVIALLEMAPELNLSQVMEFVQGLVEREIKKTNEQAA